MRKSTNATQNKKCTQGKMKIIISDTGIGIAPEALSQLFQPYHQAGSHISR